MKQKYRVFICHFSHSYRSALGNILSQFQNAIEVVGECQEYPCLFEWLENDIEQNTDCVLLGLPRRINYEEKLLTKLTKDFPHVNFVLMSPFEIDYLKDYYKQIGVRHQFTAENEPDDLLNYILN